jgi:PAS domain S-box-containing protein
VLDITALRVMILEWKSAGIIDLRACLGGHPRLLARAIRSMTVVDVNNETLRLYEARTQRELKGPVEPADADTAADMIASIAEGRESLSFEAAGRTVHGRRLELLVRLHIPTAKAPSRMLLVHVIDITERKALQVKLENERDLLRTLIDSIPEGVFLKDSEGRFTLANTAVATIMSAGDPANLIGKTDRDFYPSGMADEFAEDERSLQDTGKAMIDKVEPKTVDGVLRWIITTKLPLRDREGRITATVGISRDVTDQRRAETALSRERTYLASLMETLPDHLYFKDLQSRFFLTNKALARMFRVSDPSDTVGKSDFDFFTAEHAQAAFDDEQQIIRTGEPLLDKEERETWPDRADTWVSTTKLPLRDEEGNVIGTMGVSRDITRRRQIEEKNLRLAAMVEYSNDAIIGIDLEDMVTSWNNGAEKVFGFSGSEMVGTSLASLITPETAQKMPGMKQNLLQQGRIQQWESVVTRKDGRQVTVSSTLSPIHDAESRIVGTTLISRDVTEQRALQVQVIRAQRLESLGTLAAGIAHQFNNINAAVKGYLDVVVMEKDLPPEALSYTREALKGVQRSVEITDRLQNFTSASHASLELIALTDLVPSIMPLLEQQIADGGVTIRLELIERAFVRVSRPTMSFVITSLLSNSLHALLDRPLREVTIRTLSASGFAALEVTDTGCGITEENLPRVFTPFFTTKGEWADSLSPQTRVKGIGLSLAVCQSTIAELGGWIEAESTVGTGSTFRVWLPAEGSRDGT